MQALDPASPGPLPYTLIVAPGGKILYRHSGTVDLNELKATLIDALGAYYTPTGPLNPIDYRPFNPAAVVAQL